MISAVQRYRKLQKGQEDGDMKVFRTDSGDKN